MATEAQIAANRENAQHSTGPKSEEGKANSCKNNTRWGFRGKFTVLPTESQEEFDTLLDRLRAEHRPQYIMEDILVLKMAQHFWLSQRAQMLADLSIDDEAPATNPDKLFALWLRYQTANDRAFHKCIDQLLKLRAQRFKEAIGFERQQAELSRDREGAVARAATETRRQAAETRQQELHKLAVARAEAKLDRQIRVNTTLHPANPSIVGMEAAARTPSEAVR
jgi:hypothetical protein